MHNYKFETHLHTSEVSACARDSGADMVRACKEAGYTGVVVTDHFFTGNNVLRRNGDSDSYSWKEKVRLLMRGYENAKREGDNIGVDVYFGFEYTYPQSGSDFLIYNFGEDKILEYPEIMTDSFEKISQRVRKEGAFIIHAHPFRQAAYIAQPGRVFPDCTDAVEILNTGIGQPEANIIAEGYADKYNFCKTGGSDAHWTGGIKSGAAFKRKPVSLEDMINMLRRGEHIVLGDNV